MIPGRAKATTAIVTPCARLISAIRKQSRTEFLGRFGAEHLHLVQQENHFTIFSEENSGRESKENVCLATVYFLYYFNLPMICTSNIVSPSHCPLVNEINNDR
jgi:hypothetical protein